MPRGVAGSGTRSRTRRTTSMSGVGATQGSTATATLEREAIASTIAAGRQIKPVLEFTGQTYGFAVINNTYQAVMQHGRTWLPVATIPGFIVADWLMQRGILQPVGFMATNGALPGGTARATRNRGETNSNSVSTGNRV